ncbi:MAG: 2Fe-2S iron-sulfur cluster binding domain-containing protein [Algicola sp.]|nr:2Fe-2S iron-sulfur cluster binding domain-containing protein [Algicola sp.]
MDNITFSVNGKPVKASAAEADLPLVDFLQEDLGLTGTKFCCGIGVCRACTVSVRRQPGAPPEPMIACSTPLSSLQGVEISTIESVANHDTLHPLQQAFLTHFSFQCGYCTSGFLMAAMTLWDRLVDNPINKQDLDEVVHNTLKDHICRCTGYIRYYEAVKAAILNQPGMTK